MTQASGNCKPCFAASLVENSDRHKLTWKEASWLAGTVLYVVLPPYQRQLSLTVYAVLDDSGAGAETVNINSFSLIHPL